MATFFVLIVLISISVSSAASDDVSFTFHGFRSTDLSLHGVAEVTSGGLLKLTNESVQQTGHAFYPNPISFKNRSDNINNSSAFSFSATFVFAIVSEFSDLGGHGIAFVVSPTKGLPGARPSESLGLFNESNNGDQTNRIFAVELDTIQNKDLADINDNHVGIDINSLKSERAAPAGYYDGNGGFRNLTLISGQPMQVWVEYDSLNKQIDVTMASMEMEKPRFSLLSLRRDMSEVFNDNMYVGFSSSTGSISTSHYVLGWSFRINGEAQKLDLSRLPKLPRRRKKRTVFSNVGLPLICVFLVLMAVSGVIYFIWRKKKFAEILEDWELEYGPQRFKYKDLYTATKGFREREFLGYGGFGRVYKGILPNSNIEVAVKKISHDSRQGMKEFVAEIVSMGRLRHRNLVPLLGYCRRKKELILVYDFMPNGSLDNYLHDQPATTVDWRRRFLIIKGVAAALLYLHEEWEQVVIHRDVKASNVLLDADLNGRLGDFGLAKLYNRGADPRTTNVVGTLGYLAPEHTRTGKATSKTDVFAFGAFLLEVACGRRPIEDDFVLIEWVFSYWANGDILRAADRNLAGNYDGEQVELVLKLGLLCSHSSPAVRPSMRQIVQYLEGDVPLPELAEVGLRLSAGGLMYSDRRSGDFDGAGDMVVSYPFSMERTLTSSSSVANSILSEGR